MNGKELRIAVAEACGWSKREVSHGALVHWHSREWRGPNNEVGLPDYPNDLNAMHEAEKMLTDEQCDRYGLELNTLRMGIVGDPLDEPTINLCDWHATARQRCEAFLRTLGKWKD